LVTRKGDSAFFWGGERAEQEGSEESPLDGVYPHAPARQLVRDEIEQFLNDRGLQVVWFNDQATTS